MFEQSAQSRMVKIVFPFPIKGLALESAAHEQPELTTIDLLNVVIFDSGGVARGASRPGTTTVWSVPASASGVT